MQCPECGLPRPAGADPCPSCGAEAPAPSGGKRAGSGTSLRQWKERYQTGQLPGVGSGSSEPNVTRQFGRRTSGPITPNTGQSNPDWGNESPSSSIPPSGFSGRRSGGLGSSSGALPPTRRSGGISSPSWPRAGDTPPPPSGRSSGILNNPARSSGAGFGNNSNSWKRQNPASSLSGAGLANQGGDDGYDDQYGYQQDEPVAQPSGGFRRGSMQMPPYQNNSRTWEQDDSATDYGEMDEDGSSSNLPVPVGMVQGSGAFPMLSEEMLASRIPRGRKPPAFIPATRPRRPYRLSSYRIVSGTISLGLVALLLGGSLIFLGVRAGFFHGLLGNKSLPPISYHFPQPTLPALGTTPQATPANNDAAKMITGVTTAKNYTGTYDPLNVTTTFKPNETVNVVWQVRGVKANDVISVKWYQNGSAINGLGDQNTKETFQKDGNWNGVFGLAYPTASVGKAELYFNGQLGWSIQFLVTDHPPGTPTAPAPTHTPAGTVTPTKTP